MCKLNIMALQCVTLKLLIRETRIWEYVVNFNKLVSFKAEHFVYVWMIGSYKILNE